MKVDPYNQFLCKNLKFNAKKFCYYRFVFEISVELDNGSTWSQVLTHIEGK